MQLNSIKKGWIPLTIVAGVVSTPSSLAYAAIDNFSKINTVISRTETANYIQEVNDENDIFLNEKITFKNHLTTWQDKTKLLSSIEHIVGQVDFKAILTMGKRAVPFILEEIEAQPSNLVWALNIIFKKKITDKPNTTVEEACKLWVKALKS